MLGNMMFQPLLISSMIEHAGRYHADSLVDMGFITHTIECSCFGLPYFCRVSRSISVPSGRKQAISTPASLTQSVR